MVLDRLMRQHHGYMLGVHGGGAGLLHVSWPHLNSRDRAHDSYKLASMFVPRTSGLYANTKITMAIFAVFTIIILVGPFKLPSLASSPTRHDLVV